VSPRVSLGDANRRARRRDRRIDPLRAIDREPRVVDRSRFSIDASIEPYAYARTVRTRIRPTARARRTAALD